MKKIVIFIIGIYLLYLGLEGLILGEVITSRRTGNIATISDNPIQFWWGILFDLVVGFFCLKFVFFQKEDVND